MLSTLEQLRVFILTVECGSFTKAGDTLNVSTTAVRKQINQLETNLKITLFERSTRKLTVTPLGWEIYEKCKHILADIMSLEKFATSIQTEPQGTLHIFATPILDKFLIDPLLKNFAELYPKLNLDLTISTDSPNFESEKIDVALGIPSDFINKTHENLVAVPFSNSYRVVCASKNYFEKYGYPKKYSELSNHTYITFKQRGSDYFLEQNKFNRIIQVNNWSSILSCILNGMGIASLSYISVAHLVKNGLIEIIFPECKQLIPSIDFIYKKTAYMDPKIVKFKEYFFQNTKLFSVENIERYFDK